MRKSAVFRHGVLGTGDDLFPSRPCLVLVVTPHDVVRLSVAGTTS